MQDPRVQARLAPVIAAGEAATCAVLELEILYSTRNGDEHARSLRARRKLAYRHIELTGAVFERAIEVQGLLAARGRHRLPIPDLIIAGGGRVGPSDGTALRCGLRHHRPPLPARKPSGWYLPGACSEALMEPVAQAAGPRPARDPAGAPTASEDAPGRSIAVGGSVRRLTDLAKRQHGTTAQTPNRPVPPRPRSHGARTPARPPCGTRPTRRRPPAGRRRRPRSPRPPPRRTSRPWAAGR